MFNHAVIEKNVVLLAVLTMITISIGGLVQIIPLFAVESTIERVKGMRPFTPLELMGRNIRAPEVLARADRKWCLSKLVLPHALVRVFVSEQLFRAWSLLSNHPYHRE